MAYRDPVLGVECTCGHIEGDKSPHADDCALRIARSQRNQAAQVEAGRVLGFAIRRTLGIAEVYEFTIADQRRRTAANKRQPRLYKTRESAERAQEHIAAACSHAWIIIDHEHSRCSKCGASQFVPDL